MKERASITDELAVWLGSGSINIFGRPFSGKDTQAKALAEIFKAPIIGGGEIIRSYMHRHMRNQVASGKLAPQKEYLSLVLPYLKLPKYNNKPLIFSSLGRWHGEEVPIIDSAQKANHPIVAVIYLAINEDDVMERWQNARSLGDRGIRDDDNPQSIKTRLSEFTDKTLPVIEYYRNRGLLIEVDGTQSRDAVTQEILTKLYDLSA